MAIHPLAGKPAPDDVLVDLDRLRKEYYARKPDVADRAAAGPLRHQRPSRLLAARLVQRGAHPGHHAGDLRVPRQPGHRRPALHRQGHARPVGARLRDGARGARGQRRRSHDRQRRRLHADAGRLPRHPHATTAAARTASRTASSSPPRTIRRRTAASSTTRRTAGRRIPTSPRWIEDRANELLSSGLEGVARIAYEQRPSRRHDPHATTTSAPM